MMLEKEKGQAILELAIFGAILIMLLGMLLNYGLRYGYQQQTMQFAFRKALTKAADNDPVSDSYTALRDRHIPDPSDPFAMGAVKAFSSTASVIRSHKLDETPKSKDEFAKMYIDVEPKQGEYENEFTTAAFRNDDKGDYKDSRKRYEEVYGVGNVWRVNKKNKILDWETGEEMDNAKQVTQNRPPFYRYLDWLAENMSMLHSPPPPFPKEPMAVAIIDSSHGEILNYEAAVRQCRLIKEYDACFESCLRGANTPAACSDICSQPIGGGKGYEDDGPWYCQGCAVDAEGYYICPKLRLLFEQTRFRDMGLQKDYVQQPRIDNRLVKTEDTSGITTTDTFAGNVWTERKIFYKEHGVETTQKSEEKVYTDGLPKKSRSWQTPW